MRKFWFPFDASTQNEILLICWFFTKWASPYVDCNPEWYPFCGFDTKWDSPYVDSTQNEILLMLIQHRMRFSLCRLNPEWDSHIVLIHHRMRFSFWWFNTEWDSPYVGSTQNEILLMLIFQHKIRFFLFWFSNMEWDSLMLVQHTVRFTEWYFPSVESIVSLSQSRMRFPFCWVNTGWDSPYAESTQNEILLLMSQFRMRFLLRRANGINDQIFNICQRILQSLH